MSDTHECIDKQELTELRRRAALYEEQKPKQWEPSKGTLLMQGNGEIGVNTLISYQKFGMTFKSMEQAEEAKPLIRSHNRLIRYVQEHGGIQEFVEGKANWTVNLANMTTTTNWNMRVVGSIYMTQSCAESLAAGIKDGTVIL